METALFPNSPGLLAAAAALFVLSPLVRYRTAWLFAIALYMWADSLMPFKPEANALRAPALGALILLGAFRFRGKPGGVRPPLPAVGLALLATASVLWAEDRPFAGASVAMLFGLGILVFGLLPRMVATVDDCTRAYKGLVLVLLGLVVLGFVPIGRFSDETSFAVGGRWRGFFANPNALGSTTALLLPWVIVMIPKERGRGRAAGVLAALAIIVVCYLSGSRTAFGGLLIGGSVTLWHRYRARFILGFAALGLVLALGALVAGGDVDLEGGSAAHLIRGDTISDFSGRLDRWKAGIRIASESPALGYGYKGHRFKEIVEYQSGGAVVELKQKGENFHSQHVETLVDLGVTGEILFLALLYSVWRKFRALGGASTDPRVASLRAALLGTQLYVILDSFLNNWLLTPGSPPALVYWSIVGLALRLDRIAVADHQASARAAPSASSASLTAGAVPVPA